MKKKRMSYDEMLSILWSKFDFEIFQRRWYDGRFVLYVVGASEKEIDEVLEVVSHYATTSGSNFHIAYHA